MAINKNILGALLTGISLLINTPLQADIHIAVASNFHATLKILANDYYKHSNKKITISSASSGKIYAQIQQGAPFDIFLSADSQRPERLEQQDLALTGSRMTYAVGQLVLWSNSPLFQQVGPATLEARPRHRLAIANPRTAPYGLAARQMLQQLGLWEGYQQHLVFGENISQTFQFVSSQNTRLALISLTQALRYKNKQAHFWKVPDHLYSAIRQQGIIIKASRQISDALDFMTYLRSPAAKRIIRQQGYRLE